MSDINNYTITGHLTKDAEYRTLASGKGLLVASVAVNTGYGDYKKALFIKVQQWGERGQKFAQYLTKGSLIGCTGDLDTNEWEGKDGLKHTDIVLNTSSIQLLNQKQQSNNNDTLPTDNNNEDFVF